ncbi:cellulose binding domain-containing protein [Ktedonobacter racemifer]|nr:cellulose binding domain-containing protein [Ktedonobacter racemifer]
MRTASAMSAQVTVNAGQSLGTLTGASKGLNTAVWDGNLLDSAASSAVKNAGIRTLRYPGGSTSNVYHWQSNTTVSGQGYANPNNTFDAFMNMAQSVGAQPIITADYGAGTPQEAADWVQYANKGGSGYTGPVPTYTGGSSTGHTYGIKYWEIGNEIYGDGTYGASWEFNNNAHTSATYASNVVSYSQAMKAVDPTIKIGAVLTTPGNWPDSVTNSASPQPWNTTVLSTACSSIDFAIVHWYPQNPGNESDATLLSASAQIAGMVSTLRSELNQYCGAHASAIQIFVTETNSVSSNPGKQTVSVVNVLFEADNYMNWLENGVTNVDWWTLHNGATAGNTSSSLYGNAQYGDYGVLSNGSCTSSTSGICEPAANTPFPAYYGLQMLNYLGQAGDTMVSSSSNQSLVVAHAVKQANGNLAVLLINKDPNNSYTVSLGLSSYNGASTATVYSYGETSSAITSASGSSSSVTIAPYSLTTVILQPGTGGTPTPTPTTTSTPTPTPTPPNTPTPTPTSGSCKVAYTVTNQWTGGFGATFTITNTSSTPINGWSLQFAFPNGQKITQLWNGNYTQSGANVTITNLSYNGSIPAGGTVSSEPGFNGSWSGANTSPTSFTLNGSPCSVAG